MKIPKTLPNELQKSPKIQDTIVFIPETYPQKIKSKRSRIEEKSKKTETGGKGAQEHQNLDSWLHVKSESLALGQMYSFTFQQANNNKMKAFDPRNQEITQKWI